MSGERHQVHRIGSWSFTLADLEKAPVFRPRVRDMDNAQPEPPKPQGTKIDHPRLAPPGMAGVKTSRRLGLPPTCELPYPKPKTELGMEGETRRAFQPHVPRELSKAKTRDF